MKKILIALFCLFVSPAWSQSTAEQTVLGTATTSYPYWNPITSTNQLPIAVYDSGNNAGYVFTSNGSASAATFQPGGGGGGSSIAIQATTTSTALFPLMATTTGSAVSTVYMDKASPWNYTPSTGLTGILGITTTAFTDNGTAALNGTTTIAGALFATATSTLSNAQILAGNALVTTVTATTANLTNMALSGTATIGTAQIAAGNATLTNMVATTVTGTTGNFPTLNFTTGTGTNIALSGTITASGLSSGTVAASSFLGLDSNNKVVKSASTVTPAAGSSGNIQYNNGSNAFAAASGLNVSTTRGGLDFLANVTTANLLSLGNNGADVTSYALGESALLAQSTTNRDNTAIGGFALTALTTGISNTALGWDAGQIITVGANNTILGALVASTTFTSGSSVILIGTDNTTDTPLTTTTSAVGIGTGTRPGSTDVAVGAGSLKSTAANTNGNTAIGYLTGTAITSGTNNTVVGINAAKALTTDGFTTAVGANALQSQAAVATTSATGNTALGYGALATTITGQYNVAVGNLALNALTVNGVSHLGFNTAVGNSAGQKNTGVYENTLIGYNALGVNTNGSSVLNVVIGANALGAAINQASSNVVIGAESATSASNQMAGVVIVGEGSGTLMTNPNGNTCIGQGVCNTPLTTGNHNVIIGAGGAETTALLGTTSATLVGVGVKGGASDVAIGGQALHATSTDNNNSVAVGYKAGTAITTGINNTVLGYSAGALITTGTGNIALGNQAADTVLTTGTNNILIGNSLDVSTSTTSNTLLIGQGSSSNIALSCTAINTTTPTCNFPGTLQAGGNQAITSAGTGLSKSTVTLNSSAVYQMSYQPGLITSVTNTKSVFSKVTKTSTVDNIEGSASAFSCVSNPTITMYECGTDASCATTPTTIGTVTVTTAGTAIDGTVSNAAITAGDYVAFALTAGTCTSLDISGNAQVHSN